MWNPALAGGGANREFLFLLKQKENPMKEKKGRRKGILGIVRVSSAVVLVLALLAPGLVAQERRGAILVVTKNDGTVVRGELLAVKGTDLLIMDKSAQVGVSVSLADANLVKVVKRGKAVWILTGALVGGAVGGGLGYASQAGNHEFLSDIDKAAWAIGGAGAGILAGGIVGLVAGASKKFPIVDSDPNSLNLIASRLRKMAKDKS
jgi:hypothetical protein